MSMGEMFILDDANEDSLMEFITLPTWFNLYGSRTMGAWIVAVLSIRIKR